MSNTPAGWYPQADGQQRYWDGQQWTEHLAPGAAQAPALGNGAPVAGSSARPWFRKKRVVIPAGLVALLVVGGALSGGGDTPAPVDAATSTEQAEAVDSEAAPVAKPATAAPAKPKIPALGSKVRDGKFEFVVTSLKCGKKKVGNQYLGTEAQGEFCVAAVKVTNIGDEAQMMFSDNQYAFAGSKKFSADAEAAIYDDSSKLLWEEINPGNTAKGNVYFDVPKGTKLTKLELHDSAFSDGIVVSATK